jgi:hypothetical protein
VTRCLHAESNYRFSTALDHLVFCWLIDFILLSSNQQNTHLNVLRSFSEHDNANENSSPELQNSPN